MFGTELVYSSSDDPDLSILAARREDGRLTVLIINLSLEEKAKDLRLVGHETVQAEQWLFDPEHAAERTGSGNLPQRIVLPPQSVNLYILQ